ncbi:unnamed protein product [Urochloa humidicola]
MSHTGRTIHARKRKIKSLPLAAHFTHHRRAASGIPALLLLAGLLIGRCYTVARRRQCQQHPHHQISRLTSYSSSPASAPVAPWGAAVLRGNRDSAACRSAASCCRPGANVRCVDQHAGCRGLTAVEPTSLRSGPSSTFANHGPSSTFVRQLAMPRSGRGSSPDREARGSTLAAALEPGQGGHAVPPVRRPLPAAVRCA